MLRKAADESLEDYVSGLERDYDPEHQHKFSLKFEKKIKRLKRKAEHPFLYRTLQRVASIALAILIGGGTWLAVDVEARAAFFGWVKEVYETFFVYRFSDEVDISAETKNFEPRWVPDGYEKTRTIDTGGRINIVYKNESGQFLKFNYIYDPNETNIFVSADGGRTKTTVVGDYQADLILFDDPSVANCILWSDFDECAFYISAFLNEEDLVKIANSIYEK